MEYWKNLSLEPIQYYDLEGKLCLEEWRDIYRYEGLYQISNLGRPKSMERVSPQNHLLKERILKVRINRGGYCQFIVYKNGKSKTLKLHSTVADAFIPNPKNKPQVNHKFGIKTDNRASELEWNTSRENNTHKSNNLNKANKYTGVYPHFFKWMAKIGYKGKRIYLGLFDTELEAHYAYQRAAKEIEDGVFVPPIYIKYKK